MNKLFVLFLFCFSSFATAQISLEGYVLNENEEALIGATVVILAETDSTIIEFSLTNDFGKYQIKDINTRRFVIQVSYIAHQNYSKIIEIDANKNRINMDPIVLLESNEVLKEITIKAEHIPMGIIGDTISYNAAAFKTRPNATVEDLLRKLPGIEVKRNGDIKAQGEDVNKVLVDGKEFFGSDPKMATKNLQAEAVDKVEVFDKLSEIAEFTGIEDGEEEKTINLKLKEDYKKGGFGNALAAAGTDESYEAKLNYFRFSPTLQTSFIAASNNINKETFTLSDRIDFLGGIGGLLSSGSLDLSDFGVLEDGLNRFTSIGSNINYDFSSKVKLNSHYIFNGKENTLNKTTNSDNLNVISQFRTRDTIKSKNDYYSHAINTRLTYKYSPLLELVFKNNIAIKENATNSQSLSQYFQNEINTGNTTSLNELLNNNLNFDSHTSIRKKFKKKGRNIISTILYKHNNSASNDRIDNLDNLSLVSRRINQIQDYQSNLDQYNLTTKYTEPLFRNLYLGLEYIYASSIETPSRDYFDILDSRNIINEDLSSTYRKEYLYHIAGFSIRKNSSKLKTKVGLKSQWINLNGIINEGASSIEGSFQHWLPSLSLDVQMKGNRDASFSYSTSVSAPRLEDLLPLPVNTNPNYNFIGNPNLIPEYTHDVGVRASLFDNFNMSSLFSSINFTVSKNRIVNMTDIDEQLVRNITPVNTDNYRSTRGFISYQRPFRPLKVTYSVSTQLQISKYNSFLNGFSSPVFESNFDFKFSLQNRKTDYVSIEAGIRWNGNRLSYEINEDFNQSYSNLDYFLISDFYLPAGITISSELHYNRYSSDGFSDNPKYYLWVARLSKLFLNNKIELTLSAHDILNQNIGYRRYGTATAISEENFQNLGQYFLLGLNYKIGKGKKDNGMKIQVSEF